MSVTLHPIVYVCYLHGVGLLLLPSAPIYFKPDQVDLFEVRVGRVELRLISLQHID